MRCEYFEGCQIYQNQGEAACRRHFCRDDCPPERERRGAAKAGAKRQRGAASPGKEAAEEVPKVR